MSHLFNPPYWAARWLVLNPKPSLARVIARTAAGSVISYAMAHLILLAAHLAGPSFRDLQAPAREFNAAVLKAKDAQFQSPAALGASPAPPTGDGKGGGAPAAEVKKTATPSVILPQIMDDDAGKVLIQFLIADAGEQGLRIDPVTWATTEESLHVRQPVIGMPAVPWGWLGIEYQAPLSIDAIGKAIEALQGTIGREIELDATERNLFKARQLDGEGEERLLRFLQPRKPVEAKKWEGLLRRYQSALAAFQRSHEYQKFTGRLAIARRINGPIQFLTLWPFCGLVLIVVARRHAFVKDEQREILPLTDESLKKFTETDTTEAAAGKVEKAYGALGLLRLQLYELSQELSNAIRPIDARLQEAESNGLSEDSEEIRKAFKDKEDTYRRVVQKHAVEIERHGLNIETYLNKQGARFLPYHRMTHAAIVGALAGSAVPEHINQLVTAEEQSLSNQLYITGAACRYILWFIPTMGFIGTVWGISDSLLLTTQLDSLDPLIKIAAKSKINTSIGVAFDTTFVSLLLAAVGMLMHARVSEAEDGLIHRASDYARKLFLTVLNAMPHADVQVNQLTFVSQVARSGGAQPLPDDPAGDGEAGPIDETGTKSPALKSLLVGLGFFLVLAVIVFVLSQLTK